MGAPKLDPHLAEVLEDLARNGPPDGIFKRLTPRAQGGTHGTPRETLSIAQAGLGNMERQLLRFHREELALVLRRAFLSSFYATRTQPLYMVKPLLSREELEGDARSAVDRASPDCFTYRSNHFLRLLLRGEPVTSPKEQLSMLVASLRLDDHPHGRLYCAQVHMSLGETGEVRSIAWPMLTKGTWATRAAANSYWREAANTDGDLAGADAHTLTAVRHALAADDWNLAAHDAAGLLLRCFAGETTIGLSSITSELPQDLPLSAFLKSMTRQAVAAGQVSLGTQERLLDWLSTTQHEG